MSGIWNRVQSILDKLEEEKGQQSSFGAGLARPEDEYVPPQTMPAPLPWMSGYHPSTYLERNDVSTHAIPVGPTAAAPAESPTFNDFVFRPKPWEAPQYMGPAETYPGQPGDSQPQPIGLLQPGSYEAAMATLAKAGQGQVTTPLPANSGNPYAGFDNAFKPESYDPWSSFSHAEPGQGTADWRNLTANTPMAQSLMMPPTDALNREINARAAAIYGETSSLRPQLLDPKKSPDDPANWDPASAAMLHQARTNLATMYGTVNRKMVPGEPTHPTNPIEKAQWDLAMEAARASMNNPLDQRLAKMYMRQKGVGWQDPPESWKGFSPLLPMGPFVNTAHPSDEAVARRRAAPGGSKAYIDFYGK